MSTTAQDLIGRALKTLGALAPGESVDPSDAADALVWLNQIVDRWGTQRLTMPALLRTVTPLVSGTASYTIGSGGTINIVRPQTIDNATLIVDNTASPLVERPLGVLDRDEWAAVAEKSLQSGDVNAIFYDHGWTSGLGLIYPWPIPNIATLSLVLYTPQALTAFTNLTTSYTLAPGLAEALESHLAIRLALPWGRTINPALQQLADDALGDYKRTNLPDTLTEMGFDLGLTGVTRPSNIYTGD